MIDLEFDPFKIPSAYLEAIGLVTAASAHTESMIEDAIAGLASLDVERGLAITTHMSAPLRKDVLRSLAEIRIDDLDDLDLLDELLDEINKQTQKRNLYVHNKICMNPKTGEVALVKASARGSVRLEAFGVSVETIRADALSIHSAGLELFKFLDTRGLLPAMPPSALRRQYKTKAARKKRRKSLGY